MMTRLRDVATQGVRLNFRLHFPIFLLLLSCFTPLQAADSQARAISVTQLTFRCGNQQLTSDEVLAGRYPDVELLNVAESCKERAKSLIA